MKYADHAYFNYKAIELHHFLENNDVQIYTAGDEYYTPWEIDVHSFKNFVKKLRTWDKSLIPDEFKDDDVIEGDIIKCSSCGADIPSDSEYCPDCGKEL